MLDEMLEPYDAEPSDGGPSNECVRRKRFSAFACGAYSLSDSRR